MGGVGRGQDLSPLFPEHAGAAVVDVGRSVVADPGMLVLVVVPREEPRAEDSRILRPTEPIWKLGPVLHGLELRLRERVVIGTMRPGVGLGNAQVRQQHESAKLCGARVRVGRWPPVRPATRPPLCAMVSTAAAVSASPAILIIETSPTLPAAPSRATVGRQRSSSPPSVGT